MNHFFIGRKRFRELVPTPQQVSALQHCTRAQRTRTGTPTCPRTRTGHFDGGAKQSQSVLGITGRALKLSCAEESFDCSGTSSRVVSKDRLVGLYRGLSSRLLRFSLGLAQNTSQLTRVL